MTDIHLICAADLHLGRQVGSERSYVIQAWEILIDTCINYEPKIDALLLAGDLIDKNNCFLEIRGVFLKGISKLLAQGIPVIAVKGNHDSKILDQFHSALGNSQFRLIGANGMWERTSFMIKGRVLHIDGISFTEAHMKSNPLSGRTWDPTSEGDALIGLLHCDIDVRDSDYAPVQSSDFNGLPHHAWILWHLHIPRTIRSDRPLVQHCGSLQGLDIGQSECGPRGAWKLTIDPYGTVASTFIPLAPLRWEQVGIDVSKISGSGWEEQVLKKIEDEITLLADDSEATEIIGVRLQLEGRTSIYRELLRNLPKLQEQESSGITSKGRFIPYFLESVRNHTRPELDLASLAEGKNIVSAIARKLLQAQQNQSLPEAVSMHLRDKLERDPYLKKRVNAWPEESECLELYLNQGYALLDELLGQQNL